MKINRWLIKTLTGYTVTVVTPNKSYVITHRPFKSPKIESQITAKALRKRRYEAVFIDQFLITENQPVVGEQ